MSAPPKKKGALLQPEVRKRYSKRREEALWRLVSDRIEQLRIDVLKGCLSGLSRDGCEEVLYEKLGHLADEVTAAYRAKLAK